MYLNVDVDVDVDSRLTHGDATLQNSSHSFLHFNFSHDPEDVIACSLAKSLTRNKS